MTTRLVNLTNLTADTGTVNSALIDGNNPAPSVSENLINLRMRIATNVVGVGQFLVTIGWFDGIGDQLWQVSLNTTSGNYSELPMEIWWDHNKPVTYRVEPLAAGGSVDVRVIFNAP